MGGLYIHASEAANLKAIDLRHLERLVDEAVEQSRSGELHSLRLASCGEYVSGRLYRFDKTVIAQNKAKSAKKRAETSPEVLRASIDLVQAVRDMKNRSEDEEQERELLIVDDVVHTPRTFSPRLEVRIGYHWRDAVEGTWIHKSITFKHEIDATPNYTMPGPKRKPGRAKQEDELQEKLSRVWDQLRLSALQSVREYLKSGRDPTAIPEIFQATTDPYTRGLNNYSTQFWREPS